jgi:hypothetical protein
MPQKYLLQQHEQMERLSMFRDLRMPVLVIRGTRSGLSNCRFEGQLLHHPRR